MDRELDVCIRGNGITGCALALALAQKGFRVGLVEHAVVEQAAEDVRAYSINAHAKQWLSSLQAWPEATDASPIHQMLVWGDDGGCIRFDAPDSGPISWMVDVPALEHLLRHRVAATPTIQRLIAPVTARLMVVCEGRDSVTRKELGLVFDRHLYEQHAVAFRIRHEHEHRQCARQWFSGTSGQATILALLPLSDPHDSAVVWSLPVELAQARRQASASELMAELNQATHGALGATELMSRCASWPLQWAHAQHWTGQTDAAHAYALVGDAAHNVHPLAGLGLNLGLEDAQALARLLGDRSGSNTGFDTGLTRTLREYERERKLAVQAVGAACDGFQWFFAHPAPWARWLRNNGLSCFDRLDFLKRWTMARATHLEMNL
jgi:2-polyprenyl-6-methoxyphenol hydroxylase-like FAD-dependent oxidoreductase